MKWLTAAGESSGSSMTCESASKKVEESLRYAAKKGEQMRMSLWTKSRRGLLPTMRVIMGDSE